MKKITIWTLAIITGVSFLALLSFQIRYINEVYEMRKEQFDVTVRRSLWRAARQIEMDETKSVLEKKMMVLDSAENIPVRDRAVRRYHAIPVKNIIDEDMEVVNPNFRDTLESLIYRKELINDVIYSILYQPSDLKLEDRVDFMKLDRHLKRSLKNNGIDLTYHFTVTTPEGREVYRCSDFTDEGVSDAVYKQELFPSDSPTRMGIISLHFPEIRPFLLEDVRFMIPALVFTLLLLFIFIFAIFTILRQRRLSEIKNDFINNMTHEFKTPISTISLAAQMLNDPSVGKSEAMFQHISRVINDETKRLRFQVEKVLHMSMFDRNAATFKQKEVDAHVLISDVVTIFRLKVESSGGEIETDLDANNPMIFVDEMHFTNVLFNLLDNAVKYRHPDRPIKLKISTHTKDQHIVIGVQDNGLGIKREDLKRVFDRFYRVHTGNRHDVKGFGLGLAYVKSVIVSLKGTIHAESEIGEGTEFVITLPTI